MDIHLAINLFQLAVRSELTLTDRPFMQANLPLGCGYYMQILAGPMTGSVPSNVVLWDVEFTKLPVRLCTRLGLDLLPSAHPVLSQYQHLFVKEGSTIGCRFPEPNTDFVVLDTRILAEIFFFCRQYIYANPSSTAHDDAAEERMINALIASQSPGVEDLGIDHIPHRRLKNIC